MDLRRHRTPLLLTLGGAAVAVGLVLVVVLVNAPTYATAAAPWVFAPQVHGNTVSLTYMSGDCHHSASVEVAPTAHRVVLTVEDVSTAGACDAKGVSRTIVVRLAAPVGARTLVDGACLARERPRRPECAVGYRHSTYYLTGRPVSAPSR